MKTWAELLEEIYRWLLNMPLKPPTMPQDVPLPPLPVNTPPMPKYDFSTPQKAKQAVLKICDEMGFSLEQRNTLIATIDCESGFNNNLKHENWVKKSIKDPKTNIVTVTDVLSSTDFGICQINDYWHIERYKDFPSVQYVKDNPEKCVRWMCQKWLAGEKSRELWVCYSGGYYKSHLLA